MSEIKLTVDLEKLTEPLKPGDISFYPRDIVKYGDDCKCLLLPYKTARIDMARLDDACGHMWQTKYKRDSKGVLLCGIGIYFLDIEQWVWRWYDGEESTFSKTKGEHSDAFKRAGYMWGIGRELYEYPNVRVSLNEEEYRKNDKGNLEITNKFKKELERWSWDIKKEEGGKIWVVGRDHRGNIRSDSNPYKSKNSRK